MEDIIPDEYQLGQNYPDPFNEQTSIKYCLPKKSNIKLEIFDYRGRKVRVLVDELKEPGTYKAELSGKGLKEGIYFYRLTAIDFEETKRLLYLK